MPISRRTFAVMVVLALLLASAAPGAKPDDKPAKEMEPENKISIKKMKFSPATLTVKPGTTVIWTNNDDHDHTVAADDDSFTSGNLGNGDTFEHKFEKKGKFKYACSYHPRMKGVVVVSDD